MAGKVRVGQASGQFDQIDCAGVKLPLNRNLSSSNRKSPWLCLAATQPMLPQLPARNIVVPRRVTLQIRVLSGFPAKK